MLRDLVTAARGSSRRRDGTGSRFHGIALIATLVAMLVAVAGCGSTGATSTSSPGADPASLAPAGSAGYFSAVVRPSGSLASGALDAAREISRLSDPFGDLVQAADRSASGSGSGFNYTRDIAPWLGPRVGVFVDPTPGIPLSHTAYAVIADSTNSSKAMTFLDKLLRHGSDSGSVVSHSYRGTSYDTSGQSIGGQAGAMVKGFAVYGSVPGVEKVIDTASGGSSLAGASAYQSSGAATASGALAGGYLNYESLVSLISESGGPAAAEAPLLGLTLAKAGVHSVGFTLSATGSALAMNVFTSLPVSNGAKTRTASSALATLPGDAWFGFGLGNLGAGVSRGLAELGGTSGGSAGASGIFSLLDSHLHGLRIERDILPWLGDAGLFVTGDNLQTLGGALVIHSTRPAASKAAVPRIRAALAGIRGVVVRTASIRGADAAISVSKAGLPFVVYIVDGNGRFAIALGAQAAEQALRPSSTLASSAVYHSASDELGQGIQPSFLLSIPSLAALVLPHIGAATAAKVSSYVQAFTVLAIGAQRSGSKVTSRLVVGLR